MRFQLFEQFVGAVEANGVSADGPEQKLQETLDVFKTAVKVACNNLQFMAGHNLVAAAKRDHHRFGGILFKLTVPKYCGYEIRIQLRLDQCILVHSVVILPS